MVYTEYSKKKDIPKKVYKKSDLMDWTDVSETLTGKKTSISSKRVPKIHYEAVDEIVESQKAWKKRWKKLDN